MTMTPFEARRAGLSSDCRSEGIGNAYSEEFLEFLWGLDFPEVFSLPLDEGAEEYVGSWPFGQEIWEEDGKQYLILHGA